MAPEPRPPQPIQPSFNLRLSGLPKVTLGNASAPAAAAADEVFIKSRRFDCSFEFMTNKWLLRLRQT